MSAVPLVGARRVPRHTPAPARLVSVRAVPCPEPLCAAPVGESCRSTLGKIMRAGHVARRRIATRAHNAARTV